MRGPDAVWQAVALFELGPVFCGPMTRAEWDDRLAWWIADKRGPVVVAAWVYEPGKAPHGWTFRPGEEQGNG